MTSDTVMTMPVSPAYAGGGGMFGNGGCDWLVVLFLLPLIYGGFGGFGGMFGGFGNNGGGMNGGVGSEVQRGFDHSATVTKLDGITQGICDSTYALNNAITNGFHGVDSAICNLGTQVMSGFNNTNVALLQGQNALAAQLAQCCCDNREATSALRYDLATQACDTRNTIQNTTRDIIDSQNAGTQAILGKLSQMEFNDLNSKYQAALTENQSLKFAASQANQNAFITANQDAQTAELIRRLGRDCPVPAFVVPNPNCCYPYTGYNTGACGCGSCG